MNIYIITNDRNYTIYIVASSFKKALDKYEDEFGAEIIDIKIIQKDDVMIGE